jgi:3-deoxy-D-arabino-heptulosonate 7-phosphate (DAHP) synthase
MRRNVREIPARTHRRTSPAGASDDHSRNTLDLNVVPLVKRLSHLPILVDPSHGVGARDRVRPMARDAEVIAGLKAA